MRVVAKLPVKWSIEMDSTELRKVLLANKRLEPYTLIIRPKYAEHLEFGTGPAHNSSDGKLEMAIRDWVRIKVAKEMGMSDKNEIEDMVQKVLNNIRRHGLRARPFFRPAFYYMCEHLQEWFDEGLSTAQIIALMETKIRDLIEYNPNARIGSEHMTYTGNLKASANIYTRRLTEGEARDALSPPISPRPISNDLWEERSRQAGSELW